MSTSHSGGDSFRGDPDAVKRFLQQSAGTAHRAFPHGRAGPDDDGCLAFAITTDKRYRMIRVQFPKPVGWFGLDIASARNLIDQLSARIVELQTAEGATAP